MENKLSINKTFAQTEVKKRFDELLGKKAPGFITSVLQSVRSNNLLQKADPNTILSAAATAASLDLPINGSLGLAYIVPYKNEAQFQVGWKGFVQLALRSGQYKRINALEVYENQFKSWNALTEELDADFCVEGEGKVVGYVASFKLVNGFEKVEYWSMAKVKKHAKKYSQTFGKKNKYDKLIHSPWNDDDQFDSMAKKTVLKNTLSKYGILSIEMQNAMTSDQAVIDEEGTPHYVDNDTVDQEVQVVEESSTEEVQRVIKFLSESKTREQYDEILKSVPSEIADLPEVVEVRMEKRKEFDAEDKLGRE